MTAISGSALKDGVLDASGHSCRRRSCPTCGWSSSGSALSGPEQAAQARIRGVWVYIHPDHCHDDKRPLEGVFCMPLTMTVAGIAQTPPPLDGLSNETEPSVASVRKKVHLIFSVDCIGTPSR